MRKSYKKKKGYAYGGLIRPAVMPRKLGYALGGSVMKPAVMPRIVLMQRQNYV